MPCSERQLWMQAMKGAMIEAHDAKISSKGESGDSDEFKELEKPIFEADDQHTQNTGPSLHDDSGEDAVDSDTDSDYDRVDEDMLQESRVSPPPRPRNIPLPPIPHGDASPRSPVSPTQPEAPSRPHRNKPLDPHRREKATPPTPAPKPQQQPQPEKPRRLSEKDCLFDDSDRDKAIAILREKKAPGTFLIRKSRQGDSKVLAVMTTEDVKEYKIFTEASKVTLDKKRFFQTVDELLDTYMHEPLPNRQQTLTRSFSSGERSPHHPKSPS